MTDKKVNFMTRLSVFLTRFILWLFIIFIAVLFFSSVVSTVFLDPGEAVLILPQNIVTFIVGFILSAALLYFFIKSGFIERVNEKKLLCVCMSVAFCTAVIFALVSKNVPRADQLSVIEAARESLTGGHSSFEPGGYMYMYPHQLTYMLYVKYVAALSGDNLYAALRLLNCFYYVCLYYIMYKITSLISSGKAVVNIFTLLFLFCAVPVLYCAFLYGELLIITLCSAELLFFIKLIKNNKITDAALFVLFGVLAGVVRSTAFIMLIACVIVAVLNALNKKKVLALTAAVLAAVICLSVPSGVKRGYEKKLGFEIGEGRPFTVWFAMGLYDGMLGAGWYDDFSINIYNNSGYNTYATDIEAKKMIRSSLSKFYHDPAYALDFCYRKFATQWNEPSAGVFFSTGASTDRRTGLNESFYYGKLNSVLLAYMDWYHMLVTGCAFLCVFKNRRKYDYAQMLPALYIFGGFLFSMIWEAKSRYVLPYLIMMLPYAAIGCGMLCSKARTLLTAQRVKGSKTK